MVCGHQKKEVVSMTLWVCSSSLMTQHIPFLTSKDCGHQIRKGGISQHDHDAQSLLCGVLLLELLLFHIMWSH